MAASDDFASVSLSTTAPATHAAAVVPSDTDDLLHVSRDIYVSGAGDLVVITFGGETVTFKNASGIVPIRATRVKSTGTTATNILNLW